MDDKTLDEFSSQILIVVTTYNRPTITQLALKNITETKRKAALWVLDDHSTEYDLDFLRATAFDATRIERRQEKLGVEYQRLTTQLEAFETDYKFIYHTDNDAIHDPDWITRLAQIYDMFKSNPICLYNTPFHMQHTVKVLDQFALAARKFCPGISFFYDQSLLKPSAHLIADIVKGPLKTNWDYYVSHFINMPTVTSLVSYVEHFGADGLHNSDFERDRALCPTPYLLRNRQGIIDYLMLNSAKIKTS